MDTEQPVGRQNIIEHIYKQAPYLNPALRRIAEYVIEHPEQCKSMTIKQLATACGVAESTVTRFVKEINLASYQELKIAIAETLSSTDGAETSMPERYVYEGILSTDSGQMIVDKVVHRNIQTLTDTKQRLNMTELDKAVLAIEQAQVIVFSCMGSSAVAGEEGVMRFTRAGKKCLLFRDQSIQLMTTAIVDERDVVIGISNSGRSTPVIECLKLAQTKGAKTICITSFDDSPLVKYADIALFTPTKSPPPGLDLYGEATTSVSAQILVLDVLYAGYAVRNIDETLEFLEDTYAAGIRDSRKR
jgi:RpiR family transcriptional regulator, carbohydrate utilization regulator